MLYPPSLCLEPPADCASPLFVGFPCARLRTKERVGDRVTRVVPASMFGLLPAPLDAPPSMFTNQRRHPLSDQFKNVFGQHDVDRPVLLGTRSEGFENNEEAAEEKTQVGAGKPDVAKVVSPPMLLEKMVHLFVHGTPLSLELELNRVGEDTLRALRTPDVSIRECQWSCQFGTSDKMDTSIPGETVSSDAIALRNSSPLDQRPFSPKPRCKEIERVLTFLDFFRAKKKVFHAPCGSFVLPLHRSVGRVLMAGAFSRTPSGHVGNP